MQDIFLDYCMLQEESTEFNASSFLLMKGEKLVLIVTYIPVP